MKVLARLILVAAVIGLVAAYFLRRFPEGGDSGGFEVARLVPAPPAAEDSTPPTGLTELAAGAVAFDLKYRGRTGGEDDIPYNAFWGYGGPDNAKDPFLEAVKGRVANVTPAHHGGLKGRSWAALEHQGGKVAALYFDLNGDGQLADNERLSPTRLEGGNSVEFITPDFHLSRPEGAESPPERTFRVLLRVGFYGGSTPNFMWSPACTLEGQAQLDGKPVRMILFADGFGGRFDAFGSSSCALRAADPPRPPGGYLPRETLSSLMAYNGRYYRLRFDGTRSSGHPARAVLTPDTSPVGTLLISVAGTATNEVRGGFVSAYLQGAEDRTVCFNVASPAANVPAGRYRVTRGEMAYGSNTQRDWTVSFSGESEARIAGTEPGKRAELVLSAPSIAIRALKEQERYMSDAKEATAFGKGVRIYLEPKVVARNGEVLTRFGHSGSGEPQRKDVPPRVRIANAAGKEVLAKTMEYG